MIKQIKIYDIDGTLVDSSHRYRTKMVEGVERIDLDFWIDNLDKINNDSLLPLANEYKQDLQNPEIYVILATARSCVNNDSNYQWIEKNLGMPNKFIHRGIDDNRGGAELKIKGCEYIKNLKQFKNASVTFFEDNMQYLTAVSTALNATPVFVESNQGH